MAGLGGLWSSLELFTTVYTYKPVFFWIVDLEGLGSLQNYSLLNVLLWLSHFLYDYDHKHPFEDKGQSEDDSNLKVKLVTSEM
jgi:hypothetical protein